MQKKLIAVAVAGALGIPALALAQTATISISGRVYMEYGYTNTGSSRTGNNIINPDALQTPGSNLSVQGEEKLGGGLSAWFKCETSMDVRGTETGDSLCQRNSAIGLKGNFGNVFLGNWDTPFKRARVTTGANETGHFGTASLLTGHSTTTKDGATPGLFARRSNNIISYDSPNFGGFQVMGAYETTTTSTAVQQAAVLNKPRVISVAAVYSNGPLKVTGAYETHNKFYAAGAISGDEDGYLFGASYKFGPVELGGMYTRQKAEVAGATSKVRAWQVGADWRLAGPHSIKAAYTNAGDMKGTPGFGIARRPTNNIDTGAYMVQARYFYALSKRTDFSVGFNRLKNDFNAGYRINALGSTSQAANNGTKHTAYAMAIDHRF